MNAALRSHRRRFLLPLGSVCAFCVGLASPAIAQDVDTQDTQVDVSEHGVVDIAVQDADLSQVLQMLSMQSRKNIITSKSVSATVTANLYDVTFYEALDAILHVNGYEWEEKGNFINIYTMEEYKEIQDAERERETRIFELEYLSASDANAFISPLLSENGEASYVGDVTPGIQADINDVGADSYAFTPKIVVNDYPENLDAIADLLNNLDTPPDQVLVEATILQTAVDESNAMGVDFTLLGNINFTDVTAPLNAVGNLLNGSDPENGLQPPDNDAKAAVSRPGGTNGPGTFKVGIMQDDIAIFLNLLDQVTDNTILARPRVMALNRQRAEVLVGARIGYLSTTATETTTTQTVEFLDTGIQLVFRPFIGNDGMIRMELAPSVSEASLRTVTDAQGIGVTIPDELTNELTTNVRVRDGETLILGGLFRESTSITRRQVPVLGDIPLVGYAFRGQEDNVKRDEIIFLITPTVVHDDVLWERGEAGLAMADLVTVGAREGLLPFSREKITSSYSRSAYQAAQNGDVDLALFHIHNSLRLNPQQAGLRRLREDLTNEEEAYYERSLLSRILKNDVEWMHTQAVSGKTSEPSIEPDLKSDPMFGFETSAADSFSSKEQDTAFNSSADSQSASPANDDFSDSTEPDEGTSTAYEEGDDLSFNAESNQGPAVDPFEDVDMFPILARQDDAGAATAQRGANNTMSEVEFALDLDQVDVAEQPQAEEVRQVAFDTFDPIIDTSFWTYSPAGGVQTYWWWSPYGWNSVFQNDADESDGSDIDVAEVNESDQRD